MKATLKDWILLTRPWSVTATLIPFLVGLGFSYLWGAVEPGGLLRWGQALVSGFLLLLACNLFNTWGDERSGVDRMPGVFLTTPQIQEGKITLRQTFILGSVLFFLAGLIGFPTLFYRTVDDGWRFNVPLLVGASIGFLGAVNYSTGIKYKYIGLGVPFVGILQGFLYVFVVCSLLAPAAVTHLMGLVCHKGPVDWLDLMEFKTSVIGGCVVAFPVASLVGVIMHGNDMRDIATDRAAHIRTPATLLGPTGSLVLFFLLHLLPYAVPALFAFVTFALTGTVLGTLVGLLPFLVFPLTVRLLAEAVRDWRANRSAPRWLNMEKGSGGIHCLFGVLYALSLALSRMG